MYVIAEIFFVMSIAIFYSNCSNVTEHVANNSSTIRSSNNSREVTETQHATCQITSEELVASAQATVTRVLTGMCNADVMDERFQNLERSLKKEFHEMKNILYALLNKDTVEIPNDLPAKLIIPPMTTEPLPLRRINHPDERKVDRVMIDPRQAEIDRFNNTIHQLNTPRGVERVFTYFWRVNNFDSMILQWGPGQSVRSTTFYASPRGYALYLRLTPKHAQTNMVSINMGITRGRYDATLVWPFPLKHRIDVLDHAVQGFREDLTSVIWDPQKLCSEIFWQRPNTTGIADNRECVGLKVPDSVLFMKQSEEFAYSDMKYLWKGTLLIRLTMYI